MKKTSVNAIKLTRLLASLIACIVAVAIPLGYFALAYEYQTAVLQTEVEAAASSFSQMISANPDYWQFEQRRMEEVLSRRPPGGAPEIRSIIDLNGNVAARSADDVAGPLFARSADLYDSGVAAARLEISRSLRPTLLHTLLVFGASLLLGAAVYGVLRVFPLRALAEALQSLQESESAFRAMASTAADAIIVLDSRGAVSYWNAAAERMFGYAAAEAAGRQLHGLIAPERYRQVYRKGFEKFRQTGQGPAIGAPLEFTALRKDGSEFPIEISISATPVADGWHAVGIVRDISERKKTEQELVKLEKLESLGMLAGGLAHDFNNLLTVILGNISLTLLDTDPAQDSYRRLTDMERVVLRAQDLTRQLLTFAKGGAPVKKAVSIREVIEESCRFSLSGSSVTARYFFDDDLSPAEIDAGQIGQVMNNLVINAIQAMPDGGSLEVRAVNIAVGRQDGLPLEPGPYVRVSVRDHGPGIPKENLSKIFDPYFTTKPKGSGLGLATSYSISKRHGGYITAECPPDGGAAFHLYLPASRLAPPPGQATESGTLRGAGRILVMDDDEAIRVLVCDLLRAGGYDFAQAKDGDEAVDLYRRAQAEGRPFDAAILDLTVPGGLGGREAVRKLMELDPAVKAIVASGYSSDPVMADFKSYGFSGAIAKPYDLKTLIRVLRDILA